jgi:hypothetical protein
MTDDEPFRVAIKDSATDASEAAWQFARSEGDRVAFDSEADARRRARELSAAGETPLKIQRAAPRTPRTPTPTSSRGPSAAGGAPTARRRGG